MGMAVPLYNIPAGGDVVDVRVRFHDFNLSVIRGHVEASVSP